MIQALIFDVDGTVADTESLHQQAFNAAFQELGLDWHWDDDTYTRLLDVAGGRERLRHYWRQRNPWSHLDGPDEDALLELHTCKNRHYERLVSLGGLSFRPGIQRLMHEAHVAGVILALATTTSPGNVEALMRANLGRNWRDMFAIVHDGGSVTQKKPAPDVYLAVLDDLSLSPESCIAIEDSFNGLQAALDAGISTLVTPTTFTAHHNFEGAMLVLPHLGDPAQPWSQPIAGAQHRWADLAALSHWQQGVLVEVA